MIISIRKKVNAEMSKSIANSILDYKLHLDQNVGKNVFEDVVVKDEAIVEPELIYDDMWF